MDRRELLKLFGVGATIIPIIGGVPAPQAEAKILSAFDAEPVKESSLATSHESFAMLGDPYGGPYTMTVSFHKPGMKKIVMMASTFMTEQRVDCALFGGSLYEATSRRVEWSLKGTVLGEVNTYEGL